MKTSRTKLLLWLLGLGTVALLWSGCPVRVHVTADPSTAPPPPPATAKRCGPNEYLRGGRHVWRNGRYHWVAPRCVARPDRWRAGCRWKRGRWVRRGNRYAFRKGKLVCPRRPRGPQVKPPPPPKVAVTCGPNQYLRGGKYVWRGNKWVWVNPRCVSRPDRWRAGCRWIRGRWVRKGNRLHYRPGKLRCPKVVQPPRPRIVRPSLPPPPRPPRDYRRKRCRRRGWVYYPGRYKWSPAAHRYLWHPGRCIKRPRRFRRCKLIRGRWRVYNGRAYYIRPAWRCGSRLTYWGATGSAWTPPSNYKPFIRWKRCRRGYVHNAQGRCVRAKRRCPRGYLRRFGRCYKRPRVKRCGAGFKLRGNRCVRVGGRVKRCRVGFVRRGNKCVKIRKAGCRPGFERRGNRCVKIRKAKRCRPGYKLRGNRCVKIRKAKRCRPGYKLRGNRCVKLKRRPKRCRPGYHHRGGKCVKIRKAKRCRPGFVLRGGKCVKPKRGKRCRKGYMRRGNKCVKIKRRKR
jgi:hypothetical protein